MPGKKINTTSFLRMLPQDLEAEMSALGAIMLDGNVMLQVADLLIPNDFYRENHNWIYGAMYDLFNQHAPIDVLSVASRLKEKQQLDQVGGNTYLAELINGVPSASNAKYYAEIVRKKSILRHLIEAANHINQLGFKEEEDLDFLLDEAEQSIFKIARLSLRQNFLNIKVALDEAWERLEKVHKSGDVLRGVPTGFPDIDRLLSGLQKSDFIVLAGRPSFGKTSLALDIARHASCNCNIPVGIFSLEMSSQQLVDRLLAAEAEVDSWELRNGKLTNKEDFSRLQKALGKLSKAPLFIEDAPSLNVLQIRAMARRLQTEAERQYKGGLGLLIIDYIQLITPRREIDNPVQQMTEISRSLKSLARELGVPILALSQLSRAVEQRNPPIPRLSDLRESGAIEQDADVVMFIHREDKYKDNTNPDRKNVAEIYIAKHRNGPIGKIDLYFNEKKVTFASVSSQNFNVF